MATLEQAEKILSFFNGKDTAEVQEFISRGLLSDLTKANPSQINRNEYRKVCGLRPKDEGLTSRIDPIIKIDRSVCPTYPDWVKEAQHRELENSGPGEFDVSKLEQWLHPDQENGIVTGDVIYKYLKDNLLLEGCLGFVELLAIQSRGIEFFRKYFSGKFVFGWKSVVLHSDGDLLVPCLFESGRGVVLRWNWLDNSCFSDCPTLRLASPQD
ncbi:hypothetical protein KKC45_00975 [Patescibacteria group bacterium]|nr:hypothetical protein [Patescibacteria group bacterium]